MERSISGRMTGLDFWTKLASWKDFKSAPVSAFPHVPLSWRFDENIVEDLVVEAAYPADETCSKTSYWVAVVVRRAGYFILLRWLGGDAVPKKFFWRHVAVRARRKSDQVYEQVFPLGWARANKERFEPPREIFDSHLSWGRFLEERLCGRNALPEDFLEQIEKDNESCFRKGMMLEAAVLDKTGTMKLAVVEDEIGRRLKLRFLDNHQRPEICWIHEFSETIYPCGWTRLHGRHLLSPPECSDSFVWNAKNFDGSLQNKAPIFHFKPLPIPEFVAESLKISRFEVGSKLEVIDPYERHYIRVGTIEEVLDNLYLVVGIDGSFAPDGSDHRVCLHASSPFLLPAGFAAENSLTAYFRAPVADFRYDNTKTVSKNLLKKIIPRNDLRTNMFVEAAGVPGTDRIHVGRIVRIIGHLLLIHFEGYHSKYDQFFPITSPDLYPVGWCHLVGHRLLTPPAETRSLRDHDSHDGEDKGSRTPMETERIVVRSHI